MRQIPPLHTDRLILRPLSPTDAPALHSMYSDKETMRYMPTLPHQSVAETEQHITQQLTPDDGAFWAICWKRTDEPIGVVNYLSGTAVPGMGYIIKRNFWGQGIASEACRAALAYGFDEIGYDRVELWIDETNVQSQRVAAKLGFKPKGQIAQKYAHEANHHIMLTFGLWADEFRGEQHQTDAPRAFRAQPVLMAHDVGETAVFYRDKLGFRIDFLFGDPPNHAGVSLGNWTGRGVFMQISSVPPERELTVSSYIYIFVDARIDALYEKIKANGVEIVNEPQTHPWGMREFAIKDLNGHLLVFGTNS